MRPGQAERKLAGVAWPKMCKGFPLALNCPSVRHGRIRPPRAHLARVALRPPARWRLIYAPSDFCGAGAREGEMRDLIGGAGIRVRPFPFGLSRAPPAPSERRARTARRKGGCRGVGQRLPVRLCAGRACARAARRRRRRLPNVGATQGLKLVEPGFSSVRSLHNTNTGRRPFTPTPSTLTLLFSCA